jgi:hypothetical protein
MVILPLTEQGELFNHSTAFVLNKAIGIELPAGNREAVKHHRAAKRILE